jgi:peptide/nickel transport system substrate-binding protein
MHRVFRSGLALMFLLVGVGAVAAEPVHAIAMHGAPKLPDGFSHLPYANPDAPKGGRLRLGMAGSFDSVNPMIVKGEKVAGVREFSVESLMMRGLDEPFTLYGLLAERVDVPEDRTSITFHLNPKATFADGHPVTADDVIFSLELLRDKGVPTIFGSYYKKVTSTERLSDRVVRMNMDGQDRELPLILGLMPVLPKHKVDAATFDQSTLKPLLGSGPYQVSRVDPGRSITYKRNPDYWGRDLPVARGRFNFDEVRYDYYRDASILLEAFKTGMIDVRLDDDPTMWAKTGTFKAAQDGRVVREEMPTGMPAGMNALVMNSRRPAFADQRVRQALILLFDFEWINATLYDGRYKRTQSYFERSVLASTGFAADERERALLAPFADKVKPEVMDGTFRMPVSDGSGYNRDNARRALQLFNEAGYELRGDRLVDAKTGARYGFEILVTKGGSERLMLAYIGALQSLGIDAQLRSIDSPQLIGRINTFDFDIIMQTWQQSLSPGNEQWGRFGSAAAKAQGSRNYAGVDNAAVDAMITALLAAQTPDEFTSAVHALDRVLVSGDYVIPLFHVPSQWVSSWRTLRHPETLPLWGYNIDTWWAEPTKTQ